MELKKERKRKIGLKNVNLFPNLNSFYSLFSGGWVATPCPWEEKDGRKFRQKIEEICALKFVPQSPRRGGVESFVPGPPRKCAKHGEESGDRYFFKMYNAKKILRRY